MAETEKKKEKIKKLFHWPKKYAIMKKEEIFLKKIKRRTNL